VTVQGQPLLFALVDKEGVMTSCSDEQWIFLEEKTAHRAM